jgi:hypothetical protein
VDLQQELRYASVPETILQVAFQPTARGGPQHFIAGNIRLISAAKKLLDPVELEKAKNSSWMSAHELQVGSLNDCCVWQEWLEEKYHIDGDAREDLNSEQLLVKDQRFYICPGCDVISLL